MSVKEKAIALHGEGCNCAQSVLCSLEEYTHLICRCLAALPPDMVIHRITGDGARRALLAPLWSTDKKRVLNTLRKAIQNYERPV